MVSARQPLKISIFFILYLIIGVFIMADQFYAKNDEIKREFFRGVKDFPSINLVDKDTNLQWKRDISDHLDEVAGNRTGLRLTDPFGILKRRFYKCYRRKLFDKEWELTPKEQRELRSRLRKYPLNMHHPQDFNVNE
jgi:hypothetical protein